MNNNEKIIKKYLTENVKLNNYRCNQEYQEIHKYNDIEEELVYYIKNGWKFKLIEIEGFTAKKLNENYALSILGAYNYLIYLREEPIKALDNLKKGLPRK